MHYWHRAVVQLTGTQRPAEGLVIYLRDRVRHGCRTRGYRDVFTACPGGRSSSPTPYLNIERLGLSNVMPRIGALPKRSEEHTSELQSRGHLVCRLLLEKKKSQVNIDGNQIDI